MPLIFYVYFFLHQIAIMGCIVNGPGEMADADFGYVGGTPGKIDLYVGKVTFYMPKLLKLIKMKKRTQLVFNFLCMLNGF